jgi:ComF family protein
MTGTRHHDAMDWRAADERGPEARVEVPGKADQVGGHLWHDLGRNWRAALAFAAKTGRRFTGTLAGVVYPPSCVSCGRITAEPGALCATCWVDMRFIEAPVCAVYGTPFTTPLGEGAVSARAIADPPPFARARAAVGYEGPAVPLVHGLKFADRLDHAPWMARWMARAAPDLLAESDVVVPVPLHWRRRLSRRFNQSAELGKALAAIGGKPFAPHALIRSRNTQSQRGLTAQARRDNLAGAFQAPQAARITIAGRRVLLVDDVITTAATAAACAHVLLKAGAAEVDVIAFAMVLKEGVDV